MDGRARMWTLEPSPCERGGSFNARHHGEWRKALIFSYAHGSECSYPRSAIPHPGTLTLGGETISFGGGGGGGDGFVSACI